MITKNVDLMRMARKSLKGKWGLAVGTFFVFMLILSVVSIIPFASIIVVAPFSLGIVIFSLAISRNEEAKLDLIFQGFNKFGTSLGAYWLMFLFILLWTLLLIIPGIIAALSYSMTFYIIADEDSITAMDAITKSKKMMNGYKWKYFCLGLRFFGWALLCFLTFGIGFLWLFPYIQVSVAKFYEDVKANYESENYSEE